MRLVLCSNQGGSKRCEIADLPSLLYYFCNISFLMVLSLLGTLHALVYSNIWILLSSFYQHYACWCNSFVFLLTASHAVILESVSVEFRPYWDLLTKCFYFNYNSVLVTVHYSIYLSFYLFVNHFYFRCWLYLYLH